MKQFNDMEQEKQEERERQRFCQLMEWYLEAHGRELQEKLNEQLTALHQELNGQKALNEELNGQLASQEAQNQELNEHITALHQELNGQKALNEELNGQLASQEAQNQELNEQLMALHGELSGLNVQVTAQEKLNRELEAQLQSQMALNRRLADQLGQLEHFLQGYGLFRQVPERLRGGLAEALGCHEDIESFICGAAQERHLDSLWKYISYAINSRQAGERDAALLNEIFHFAFSLVSRGSRHPSYELIEVPAGTAFSPLSMARVEGSRQQGMVSSQWLAGYGYKGSGKVVNPAMVMVE